MTTSRFRLGSTVLAGSAFCCAALLAGCATQPTGPIANMHGVAFNADVYLGNTHKTDGVLYGDLPATATAAQTPDNAYLANVYRAVNAAATANGQPIRIITSSWGSQPNTENYNTYDTPPGSPARRAMRGRWRRGGRCWP